MRHERAAEFAMEPVDRLDALRLTWGGASAHDVLAGVLTEFPDQVAIVSSFGADAAVLLHMVSEIDRDAPVLLVDTLMLFEETLEYQRDLSATLGLRNVQHIRAEARDLAALDPGDDLHERDPDACCVIRKVAPLDRALRRFPVCVSGRKRFQSSSRAALETFEADKGRLRVSPLAGWSAADLAAYMDAHDPCRAIRWWRGAIRPSAARPARAAWPRARTSGPGAGAERARSNAASISPPTESRGPTRWKERFHECHRVGPGFQSR